MLSLPAQVSLALGSPEFLRAEARDSDDGRITGTDLVWTLTGPMSHGGTGGAIALQGLIPGDYVAEVEATDAGGLSTIASLSLTIEPKEIAFGTSPIFDGACDDVAYGSDPSPVPLRYSGGELVEVAMIRSGEEVYVCASGMFAGLATEFFEIRIDSDGSADALMQSDDRFLRISQDGFFEHGIGDGAGSDSIDPSNLDADALSRVEGQVWQAEIRLSASLIGEDAAIAFRHVDSLSGVDWPVGFDPISPTTWGGTGLGGISTGPNRLIGWSGILDLIFTDSGQGAFSGGTPGESVFDGYFGYPERCIDNCLVASSEANQTVYAYPNTVGLARGVGAFTGTVTNEVEISDDFAVDAEFVNVASQLGLSVQVGQEVDGWQITMNSHPAGTPGGVKVSLIYIYASTDPFDSTEYTGDPPALPGHRGLRTL